MKLRYLQIAKCPSRAKNTTQHVFESCFHHVTVASTIEAQNLVSPRPLTRSFRSERRRPALCCRQGDLSADQSKKPIRTFKPALTPFR
jgi:hypothetical protein